MRLITISKLTNGFIPADSQAILPQLEDSPGPGVLSVTLYEAIGLSAPEQHKEAFDIQQHESLAQSDRAPPWVGRSYQHHHRPYWPYAVLCLDQFRAFAGSILGTTDNPGWAGEAIVRKFYMVRASELSVRLYLKRAETCHEANQDILLGVVKLNPSSIDFRETGFSMPTGRDSTLLNSFAPSSICTSWISSTAG